MSNPKPLIDRVLSSHGHHREKAQARFKTHTLGDQFRTVTNLGRALRDCALQMKRAVHT